MSKIQNHEDDIDQKGSFSAEEKVTVYDASNKPQILKDMTEEEYNAVGKSATWKLDLVIMPIIVAMYILNYLDRQNISAARLANITVDLSLSPVEYQTCISILFAGYILAQTPSNMIAGKVRNPALYINICMIIWGILSAVTAAVQGFGGLLAIRLILGVAEAAFFPGALFYLSTFYNKKQFGVRTAILYSGSQLGNAFGGLLAIGIFKLDGVHNIAGWRWLFIIEGVATVGLGIVFAFLLPSNPRDTPQLNEAQRAWVLYNLQLERGASDSDHGISSGRAFIMAVTDPKLWLYTGCLYCTYIAGAVVQFFPSVVQTLGYDRQRTLLLTAPPYLLCVIVMIINGFHSDRKQERFLHVLWPLPLIAVTNAIAVATQNTAARYVAMMLMPTSFYASAIIQLSWITSSINQPPIKRAVGFAFINSLCNTPNIWTSYLYKGAPRYLVAFSVNCAAGVGACLFAVAIYIYLRRQNSLLDRGQPTPKSGPTEEQVVSGFRYML